MKFSVAWWQWVAMGGLVAVAAYYTLWISILTKMDEVEDGD